jgi:multidrug efflux pump subunit AcrB
LTLAASVLLSLGYALLFIPNAAERFLQDRREHTAHLGWLTERYRFLLQASLARPRVVAGVTLALALAGGLLYFRLETGFLPEMDEGGYVIGYWTPEGTSLPETDRMVHRIEAVVAATPEVAGFARRTADVPGDPETNLRAEPSARPDEERAAAPQATAARSTSPPPPSRAKRRATAFSVSFHCEAPRRRTSSPAWSPARGGRPPSPLQGLVFVRRTSIHF